MNVSPISFSGIKEINKYARTCAPLTSQEKDLKKKALDFAQIEPIYASDGSWCSREDELKAEKFILALNLFKATPSQFAYHIAVDAVDAPAIKQEALFASEAFKDDIQKTAREIAYITPEVTKEDICKDFNKLG